MKKNENLYARVDPFVLRIGIENLYVYYELEILTSLIVNDPDYFLRLHKFNKRYLHSKKKEKSV